VKKTKSAEVLKTSPFFIFMLQTVLGLYFIGVFPLRLSRLWKNPDFAFLGS